MHQNERKSVSFAVNTVTDFDSKEKSCKLSERRSVSLPHIVVNMRPDNSIMQARSLTTGNILNDLGHRDSEEFDNLYEQGQVLGYGGGGTVVKIATDLKSGEDFVVKIVKKSMIEQVPSLRREVSILKGLNHPNIIRLKDFFIDDPEYLYVVMERGGMELFDLIIERKKFDEDEAKFIAYELTKAVEYLHFNLVSHRDLKPENVLCRLSPSGRVNEVKLVDFGLANLFESIQPMMTPSVGTVGYKAPEQLTFSGYRQSIDLWSMGVIVYILLSGYPPFRSKEFQDISCIKGPFWIALNDADDNMLSNIATGNVMFHSPGWETVSPLAKDFVSRLLQVDPAKRLNSRQALIHPWFTSKKLNHVINTNLNYVICHRPDPLVLKSLNILKTDIGSSISPSIQIAQDLYLKACRRDILCNFFKTKLSNKV